MRLRRFGWISTVLMLAATFAHAAGITPPTAGETEQLLKSDRFEELDRRYSALQSAYEHGSMDDESLLAAFRVFYDTDGWRETRLDAWVRQFPKSYVAHLAKGIYLYKLGVKRRGSEYISEATATQQLGMREALGRASQELTASLSLNSKPILTYLYALDIASFMGFEGKRRMLDRSLEIDPGNFIVRRAYMGTLQTRWGGSIGKMSGFLEENKRANVPPNHLKELEGMVIEDRGWVLENEGDRVGAEREYEAAAALGRIHCLVCYAERLTKQQRFSDALRAWSQVLANDPANTDALASRGSVEITMGLQKDGLADWNVAAAKGNAYAQSELGRTYLEGIPGFLSPDSATGIAWLRKAAAQGEPAAQENLKRALACPTCGVRTPNWTSPTGTSSTDGRSLGQLQSQRAFRQERK